MYVDQRKRLHTQALAEQAVPETDDTVRFNALCRGEELRVSLTLNAFESTKF